MMAERMVIYDSVFGNTQKVAAAIGDALGEADVKKVSDVDQTDLENLKILFVGSPTRVFRPTPETMDFLKGLGNDSLVGVKAAVFDTRIPIDQTDSRFLRTLIKLFGYADTKIEKALAKTGVELALKSEGFGVTDTEGPLVEGELERASRWAKEIL
jgi:flavodoxin I